MSEDNPHDPDVQIIEDVELMEEINNLTELGTTLIQAIFEKEPIGNIRDLTDAGAPLWFQDNEGTSPLHAAAYVGDDQLVKLLFEEGAPWNAGESFLTSSLHPSHRLRISGQPWKYGRRHRVVHEQQRVLYPHSRRWHSCRCFMHSYFPFTLVETLTELLLTLVSAKSSLIETPSSLVIRRDDASAAGSTDAFLASRLQYTKDAKGQEICLLKLEDGGEVGVMMGWEREISKLFDCLPNHVRVVYEGSQCAKQSTNFVRVTQSWIMD